MKPSQTNQQQYAALWPRFLALVADFIILSIFFFPLTRIIKGVWIMNASDHLYRYGYFVTDPLCLIFLVIIVLYFVLLEGLLGATPGKRLFTLRVIDENGNRPGLIRALIRNLLRAVDALPAFSILGIVMIATSPERARLGDRIAGTRVIYNRITVTHPAGE